MRYFQLSKKFKVVLCGLLLLAGCSSKVPVEQYTMQGIVGEIVCEDAACEIQLKSIENGSLILYCDENQVVDLLEGDYVDAKYRLDDTDKPVLAEISKLECEMQIMEINGISGFGVSFSSAQINKSVDAIISGNFMRFFSEGDIVKVFYLEEASAGCYHTVIYMEKSGGLYEQEYKASEVIGFIPTKIVIEEEEIVGLEQTTVDDEEAIEKLMAGLDEVLVYKDYAIQHWFGTACYTVWFYNGDEEIKIGFDETLTMTYPDGGQEKYGYRTSNLTFETCGSIMTKWLTELGLLEENE